MKTIDFRKSFITWQINEELHGRFSIEACLRIQHPATEIKKNYYLLSKVLACNVLEKAEMIHQPEYMFQAVFSETDFKIFRINNSLGSTKDNTGLIADSFKHVDFHIEYTNETAGLSHKEVCEATLHHQSLTSIVSFTADNYIYEMEFPVKHINFKTSDNSWQIETGPVLASGKKNALEIENLTLAFIALNHNGDFNQALLDTEKENNHRSRFYQKKPSDKVTAFVFKYNS